MRRYLPNMSAPPGAPRNVYDTGAFSIGRDRMPKLSFLLDYADPSGRAGGADHLRRGLQQDSARHG